MQLSYIYLQVWFSDRQAIMNTPNLQFLPCDCERIRTVLLSTTVCPSDCLPVKCVNCNKTKETSAHIFIPHERKIHLVFRHEEWLVGDVPFYLKFCTYLFVYACLHTYQTNFLGQGIQKLLEHYRLIDTQTDIDCAQMMIE